MVIEGNQAFFEGELVATDSAFLSVGLLTGDKPTVNQKAD